MNIRYSDDGGNPKLNIDLKPGESLSVSNDGSAENCVFVRLNEKKQLIITGPVNAKLKEIVIPLNY